MGVTANVPTIGVGKNFLQIDDGKDLTMAQVKTTVREKLKKGGDTYLLQGQSGTIWGSVCIKKRVWLIIFEILANLISKGCSKSRLYYKSDFCFGWS